MTRRRASFRPAARTTFGRLRRFARTMRALDSRAEQLTFLALGEQLLTRKGHES